MDYIILTLRILVVYALLCLGVEVYNTLFKFEPAKHIADQAIIEHNFDLSGRCIKVMDDVIDINPFNLPASIKAATTDFMKKEGCK